MSNELERPDGRQSKQLRDVTVEVGILHRADGSSKVRLGKNLAIASVYGPRELHPKHSSNPNKAVVRINYRMATFSVTDYKRSFPSRREKEISKVLSEAFESVVLTKTFPRSAIDVHVQIFESDGGTRTAAAIAASAALADAGIPMRSLTAGIASGIYGDKVVLDLNGQEDMKGTGDMPIIYSPTVDEISLFQLDGMFTFDQFTTALNYSIDGVKEIVGKIENALKEKYLSIRDELTYIEHEESKHLEEEEAIAETVVKSLDEIEPSSANVEQPNPVEEQDIIVDASEAGTSQGQIPIIDQERDIPQETPVQETIAKESSSIVETETDGSESIPDPKVENPSNQSEDESNLSSDTDGEWYVEPKGLKPMAPVFITDDGDQVDALKDNQLAKENEESKENNDTSDVLRDIEYTDFEEE